MVPVASWPTAFTVYAEFSDCREASVGAQPPTRTFWASSSWSETGQRNSLRATVKWRKGQARPSETATGPLTFMASKRCSQADYLVGLPLATPAAAAWAIGLGLSSDAFSDALSAFDSVDSAGIRPSCFRRSASL